MKKNNSKTDQLISRKKFLRACGSIVAGGTVIGVSGIFMKNMMAKESQTVPENSPLSSREKFASPYKLISSFAAPGIIDGLTQHNDKLYVAAANSISTYNYQGERLGYFQTEGIIRDIAVKEEGIYLLQPTKISIYAFDGEPVREWEACSELSDYCSFVLTPDFVFVTDVANKNICQYSNEGNFIRFIDSPNGFIIPSYTFGIEFFDNALFCSNPGRHQVEKFSPNGEYVGAFGKAGTAPGLFTGCCNPVYLSYTTNGDLITSEKGDPRISCYSKDGKFRNMLLDKEMLGGGNTAYDVKVHQDKIFVAGKNIVSIFRFDKNLASGSGCSGCGVDCPLIQV